MNHLAAPPVSNPEVIPPLVAPDNPLDDLDSLGDRIATLSAQIQAATYALLVMIREFDERDGWANGFNSCAHWLNWRTGLNLGAAREKVRVARALGDLPLISEQMSHGTLCYSKVRALTRVATPNNEAEILELATVGTTAHVERLVRGWRRVDRIEASARDEMRRESRYSSSYTDENGMLVIRARLEPEAGAVFLRALEAATDALYDQCEEKVELTEIPFERRQADALALVAESALAAELDPGTRGDRYQVVVHVDERVLEDPDEPGMSTLEDGADVSAGTSRRLACDCAKVEMTHDPTGRILDVGRRTRTISPALRRALVFRDRGCRFPGCGIKRCDGHHVEHWADGGETKLENVLSLCHRHHRAVHEEGFTVELLASGEARFCRPDGREVVAVPPIPGLTGDPVGSLQAQLVGDGIDIDETTGMPDWDGRPVDMGWAVDWLRGVDEVH